MGVIMQKTLIRIVVALVVALVLVFSFFAWKSQAPAVLPPADDVATSEPYRATLTGIHVCLPHKEKTDGETLECVAGIQTDEGTYYALDLALMSQTAEQIPSGTRFTASGLVTPIAYLSADRWEQYEVTGIFSITDSLVVETPPTEVPVTPSKKCYIGGCSAQLCTDQPDMASTCEYRDEYACYQGATCEVQADGECGWTETPAFRACIAAAGSAVFPQ